MWDMLILPAGEYCAYIYDGINVGVIACDKGGGTDHQPFPRQKNASTPGMGEKSGGEILRKRGIENGFTE